MSSVKSARTTAPHEKPVETKIVTAGTVNYPIVVVEFPGKKTMVYAHNDLHVIEL